MKVAVPRAVGPAIELTALPQYRPLPAYPAHYTLLLLESPDQPNALTLHFSAPGQPMPAGPRPGRGQQLRFAAELVDLAGPERELLLGQLFYQQAPVLVAAEPAAELLRLLAALKHQAAGHELLREALLRAYLNTLLLHCAQLSQQQFGPAASAGQPGLVARFQRVLEQQFTSWKSVHEYAAHLRVTANHLSVTIRRHTGQTAGEHIRRRVMREAQRLATRGDASLKEVAYQLGFDDPAHFSKLFKRCTGTTFSRFKQQNQAATTPLLARVAA